MVVANVQKPTLMFVIHNPGGKRNGKIEEVHIMDCAATILSLMGVPLPDDMRGKVIES